VSIEDVIAELPDSVPLGVDSNRFALDIVRHVVKDVKRKPWVGGGSIIAPWAVQFIPKWAHVSAENTTFREIGPIADKRTAGSSFVRAKAVRSEAEPGSCGKDGSGQYQDVYFGLWASNERTTFTAK